MTQTQALPPFRKVDFLPVNLHVEKRKDGSVLLRNLNPMGDPAPNLIAPIRAHAKNFPSRVWLAERPKGPLVKGKWNTLTYAETDQKVSAVAAALIERGLDKKNGLMILSGNSIAHALMTYGAMAAGAPVTPVSEAWSLLSADCAKLRHAFALTKPKMIFVEDDKRFANALAALDLKGVEIVTCAPPRNDRTAFDDLLKAKPSAESAAREQALHWDTTAKYLFTSGSTGMPKAVINTHGMMCVNAVMGKKLVREKPDEEPNTILSWLPWNHTFGGNAILNGILANGGTLYLDRGRPLPGMFDETIAALAEIAPTAYSNVPISYGMLADALEKDSALATRFFSRLKSMAYGGAAMGRDMAERIQKIAVKATGERILFLSGYGATETAPTIMSVHWETERMGLLGLPLPGVDIKLAPVGSKMEVRVKGACITPGYHGDAEKTKAAFDEEGFYKLGDAALFADENDPAQGLVFDGRVAEDFKLATGTWVNAGRLRIAALDAAGGLLRDAVITGLDREEVGLLGFPDPAACAKILKEKGESPSALATHPELLALLAKRFADYNAKQTGSAKRIKRLSLTIDPPDMDVGEITDKGYINQGAVLSHRAGEVERLYESPAPKGVLVI